MSSVAQSGTLLCVATQKGLVALESAIQVADPSMLHVCTFEETGVVESHDARIRTTAKEHGCQPAMLRELRENFLRFVIDRGIARVLCIGWRYIVPMQVVHALNGHVVVAHDSLLPRLRGFAPLPTAMIIGERETGVTFLRAGAGADDGDILWQGRVAIDPDDTIAVLTEKVLPLYAEGTKRFLNGDLKEATPQSTTDATYSIWRDEFDYRIDWSADAATIERSVRALGPPYLGAKCRLGASDVTIRRATVMPDLRFAIRQPGKVWSLDEAGRPLVVCGSGLLRIDDAVLDGASLLPLRRLRIRFE